MGEFIVDCILALFFVSHHHGRIGKGGNSYGSPAIIGARNEGNGGVLLNGNFKRLVSCQLLS